MGNITPDYPRGITFEQVWAAIQEVIESQKETDMKFQETDKKFKETEKLLDKVTKNIGGLGNSIGGLVETLVAARLWEKFSSYPYGFSRAYRRVQVFDDISNRELTDIDILLSDSQWVMAVEVKHEVVKKDVEQHIKRMNLIRNNPPAETRGKKLLGAVAGGTIDLDARNFAFESGFFVLELRGESVELLPLPEGFNPIEW